MAVLESAVDTLTFTTLAPQPGARYAAPEAVEQLALVRYALEWDGGYATVPGGAGPQPTYNLVKRVRFPCTSDPNLNMDQFDWAVIRTRRPGSRCSRISTSCRWSTRFTPRRRWLPPIPTLSSTPRACGTRRPR